MPPTTRTRLTALQSQLVTRCYAEHNGIWPSIMDDEHIKLLCAERGLTEDKLKAHIKNKRKKKNKKKNPNGKSGGRLRRKIVSDLEENQDCLPRDSDTEDEDALSPEELSEGEAYVNEVDQDSLDYSVDSDLQTSLEDIGASTKRQDKERNKNLRDKFKEKRQEINKKREQQSHMEREKQQEEMKDAMYLKILGNIAKSTEPTTAQSPQVEARIDRLERVVESATANVERLQQLVETLAEKSYSYDPDLH